MSVSPVFNISALTVPSTEREIRLPERLAFTRCHVANDSILPLLITKTSPVLFLLPIWNFYDYLCNNLIIYNITRKLQLQGKLEKERNINYGKED